MSARPPVTILYQYFHPDDVVSARHFSDLAAGLAQRGWRVTARPSNRSCRHVDTAYSMEERWSGVFIRRVWRPVLLTASHLGRIISALWIMLAWALQAWREPRRPGIMIVGTDPVCSVAVACVWKRLRPDDRIAHWCFDLYPEAPIASGMFRENGLPARVLRPILRSAYRSCDLIADLGQCMADRLKTYRSKAKTATLPPWALVEPEVPAPIDPTVRNELFGKAKLGLLYSGNFGRAHSYEEFIALARQLRGESIGFCFASRGNRIDELRRAVGNDSPNISWAGFAPEAELEKRLGACDLHLVSLRPEWTGTVVPSKFFGALAAGRGVVFAGSPKSAIAQWIVEHRVGWVLTPETAAAVADDLRQLAGHPEQLLAMNKHCQSVYREHFSRDRIIDRWDTELRSLIA